MYLKLKGLFVAGLLTSACAHADLALKVFPYVGEESKVLRERLDAFTRQYVDENSRVSEGYPYRPAVNYKDYLPLYWLFDSKYTKLQEAETLYKLTLDGRDYFAAVISFNPLLTVEPHCQPNDSALPEAHCDRIATRQKTCHLFLFEPQTLALESVAPLSIQRDPRPMPGQKERSFWNYDPRFPNDPRQIEGWPVCSKLLAVSPAKAVPDALLFTLGYFDSAEATHKFDEPPMFKTSVLLSLKRDASGKVAAVQDDRCFGNPNTLSSIAEARNALRRCAAKQ